MKIKIFKFQFFAGVTIFSLFSGISVYAQSPNETDSLQTEEISQDNRIKINGYLRAGIFGGEKEIRNYYGEGALKLEVPIGISASAFSEVRYRADGNNNHKFDIREAYVNLNLGKFDFRVGEQIVLWGRADGFNPTNNVTPQDFCVFSPEEDDKRLGNFVVKGVFNPYPFRIEVDWIPVYKSSLFPFIGKPMGDGIVWNNEKRPYRWKNQSFGVKIDLEKPSLGNYGLRGEFACSLPDKGNNPIYSVPNKQMEYTIGIDRSLDNFSLIVQYIGKYIPDLETAIKGNPIVQKLNSLNRIVFTQHERWNHSVSVRPALSLLHETLNLELLGLCQFSTKEYFFQPKIRYAIADAVTLTVGGQLFYGPDDRLFGILEKTKNSVFTELKVSF